MSMDTLEKFASPRETNAVSAVSYEESGSFAEEEESEEEMVRVSLRKNAHTVDFRD